MLSRSLILHLSLILPAAGLGYLLGGSSSDVPAAARQAFSASSPPRSGIPGPGAWETSILKVRLAPASRSKQEWAKWTFTVPDGDLARAVASLNPHTDLDALRLLLCRWVTLDPAAAWRAFDALPIPLKTDRWFEGAGVGAKGLAMTTHQRRSDPRSLILGRMLMAWHSVDPAASTAHAEKLHAEGKEDPSYHSGTVTGKDLTHFLAYTNSSQVEPMLRRQERSKQEWVEALKAVRTNGLRPDNIDFRNTLCQWAVQAPTDAARWMLDLPADQRSATGMMDHLVTFNQAPPASRMELFTAAAAESPKIQEAVEAFIGLQPKGEPGLNTDSKELQQLRFGADALKDWFSASPAEAKAWLASQPEGAIRNMLYGQVAAVLSRTVPNEAIALLDHLPDAALPTAVAGLTEGWVETDAAACAEWVAKIDDIPTRDASWTSIIRQVMNADPEFALKLSLGITDDSARGKLQQEIASALNWNPAALRRIIDADPDLQESSIGN